MAQVGIVESPPTATTPRIGIDPSIRKCHHLLYGGNLLLRHLKPSLTKRRCCVGSEPGAETFVGREAMHSFQIIVHGVPLLSLELESPSR